MNTTSREGGSVTLNLINQQQKVNILPSRDLLDGNQKARQYRYDLYRASQDGNVHDAHCIIRENPNALRCSILESGETALHIAVTGTSYEFVKYLVNMMRKNDLELQNDKGETALCVVARAGTTQMAKILVENNKKLIYIDDCQKRMPINIAALYGKYDTMEYLYSNISLYEIQPEKDLCLVLEKRVEFDLFDVALQMVTDIPELAINARVLKLLAGKPYAFQDVSIGSSTRFGLQNKLTDALILLKFILKEMHKFPQYVIDDLIQGPPIETTREDAKRKNSYRSQLLFLAIEMGNIAFAVEVIKHWPSCTHEVNDINQSLFHVAVSHRHEEIYKLLYDYKHVRDLVIPLEDNEGNNMLHLVGMHAKGDRLPSISGMGLRTNLELKWFKVHLSHSFFGVLRISFV